jgi:hypothetical protein
MKTKTAAKKLAAVFVYKLNLFFEIIPFAAFLYSTIISSANNQADCPSPG